MSQSPARIRLATFLGFRTALYQADLDKATSASCIATLNLIKAAQAVASLETAATASSMPQPRPAPVAPQPPAAPPRGMPPAQPYPSGYFASMVEGEPEFATDFGMMRRNVYAMLADLRRKAKQLEAMASKTSTAQPPLDQRQPTRPGKRPDRQ